MSLFIPNILLDSLLLLIVSGNVELNPGPMKRCPKCKKMMSTRSNNCKCGYLLCYVAARVLYFSAFIVKVLNVYSTVYRTCTCVIITYVYFIVKVLNE